LKDASQVYCLYRVNQSPVGPINLMISITSLIISGLDKQYTIRLNLLLCLKSINSCWVTGSEQVFAGNSPTHLQLDWIELSRWVLGIARSPTCYCKHFGLVRGTFYTPVMVIVSSMLVTQR